MPDLSKDVDGIITKKRPHFLCGRFLYILCLFCLWIISRVLLGD